METWTRKSQNNFPIPGFLLSIVTCEAVWPIILGIRIHSYSVVRVKKPPGQRRLFDEILLERFL
jgi:hypothetical protein